jgi:hypothetical protein
MASEEITVQEVKEVVRCGGRVSPKGRIAARLGMDTGSADA